MHGGHFLHMLLNFFGCTVQGCVESFDVGKSRLGSEVRQSYRLFTTNQLMTPVLCSSFKHLQPQLKNGLYIIEGLRQQKGGTRSCPRKAPPTLGYFKERFLSYCHIYTIGSCMLMILVDFVYFSLQSVIIHMFVRKKAGIFQPTT